ncbi:MAG: hypothetical protein ABII85_07005 [Bacillota bacterium]
MNKIFKLFALLLMVGLVFGLSACKPDEEIPEITEFNVLGNWTDGGDDVYTLTTNTESELEFSYDKATFPYAFIRSADITQDLSIFKKLVITVEGTGTILVKIETNDTTPAKEVGLNVTGIQGTYEWNLINDSAFLAKVDKIVIIAAPGKEASIGSISVSTLKFDVEVADGYIIQSGFTNIPTNVNEYNGTDVDFDFNMKWENFAEETYTISYVGATTVVAFDKATGQEWSTMQSRVQGDFTDFNYVVAIVSGTVGQKFLLKAANDYENFVFLTAEEQEVVVDISAMTVVEKNAITAIFAFGSAGMAGTGNFVIHEAFMTEEYDYEAPIIIKNIYNGTDLSFSIDQWYDGGDMNYDFTVSGTDLIVDYEKTADWAYMVAHIEGDLSPFAKLEFEVTGTLNKTALFKVESPSGNIEQSITFDGTRQTVVIELSAMTPTAIETINKVVIFAAPGGSGAGQFTLHSTTFMTSDFSLQDTWAELDAGTYAFSTTVDDTVLVTYTKVNQEWVFMKSVFTTDEVAGLNTLNITLKGTDGKQVLVKANGVEQWVTFVGTDEATVTFTAASFTEILMCAEGGIATATGTFEIISAILSYVTPDLDPTLIVDFNDTWVANVDTIYVIDSQASKTAVTYTKLAGNEWEWMRAQFNSNEVYGLNTMTLILKGTAGTQILIKPNDNSALEQSVTFTDTNQVTVTLYAESFISVYLFAEPNVAPASGSFEILSATLSYSNMPSTWTENDVDTYDFTAQANGSVKVDYTKSATQGWAFMRMNFTAEEAIGYNTLTIILKGTVGKTVLVKPNDLGAMQASVTFTDENPVTLTFYGAFTTLLIFAEPDTVSVTGTFYVTTVLSKTAFDEELVVDIADDVWTEGTAGVYTLTEELDGSVTVDYTKTAGQAYVFIKKTFEPSELIGMNTLTLVLQGTAGQKVLIKPNDYWATEQLITFTDDQPVTIIIEVGSFYNLIIFAEPGVDTAITGSFSILSATLSYTAPIIE